MPHRLLATLAHLWYLFTTDLGALRAIKRRLEY